jgi:hypothetical protein
MVKVVFTATCYNPDTEEEFNGYLDPKWSKTTLFELESDVTVFEVETEAEALELIKSYIGEPDSFDGVDFYAADSHDNYETGENWTYHARINP